MKLRTGRNPSHPARIGHQAYALLVLVWLSLTGCRGDSEQPISRAAATPKINHAGETLVRRLRADVDTLNPVRMTSIGERYVANYLYTPLIRFNKRLEPIAGLATGWTISADGRLYTFTLQKNATFSDGHPVRASDVVFTLRKALALGSLAGQMASQFELLDLERTRATNDQTVEVAFREPLGSQLSSFNRLLVIPEHVYGKGHFANDHNRIAVGSGPYKLVSNEPGKLTLERRNNYWGPTPKIDKITFQTLGSDTTAWYAVTSGRIHETRVDSGTWWREQANASKHGVRFERFYTHNYNFIAWNGRHPILRDKNVRRALAMCVPTTTIVNQIYHGTARPLTGPFMPGSYAYNPDVAALPHDLNAAKRVLATAGWVDNNGDGVLEKGGKSFRIEMVLDTGNSTGDTIVQAIQAEFKRVGVQVAIRQLDESALLKFVLAGNYEAAYLGSDLGPEPDPYARFHSSQLPPDRRNFVYYSNAEADRLMESARREVRREKRGAIYQRLHKVLAEDQPYTWVVQVEEKWAIDKHVRGVAASTGYGLFRWYPGELEWQLTDSEPR